MQGSGSELIAEAAGKFDHRRFADQDGAHVIQVIDHGGVVVEDLIGERFRAPGCGDILDGEQVFGGVRNAVKRAAIVAAMDFFFGGLGLFHRESFGDAGVGVEPGAELLAAFEIAFGEFDGGELLGGNLFGEFANRGVKDRFFEHSGFRQPFLAGVADCDFLSRSTSGFK